jgi:hypothetical protein
MKRTQITLLFLGLLLALLLSACAGGNDSISPTWTVSNAPAAPGLGEWNGSGANADLTFTVAPSGDKIIFVSVHFKTGDQSTVVLRGKPASPWTIQDHKVTVDGSQNGTGLKLDFTFDEYGQKGSVNLAYKSGNTNISETIPTHVGK